MSPGEALPNPTGKTVPSMAPGADVRDMSGDLQRHRDHTDACMTTPPSAGYPQTVGSNPGAPAVRETSDEDDTGVTTTSPGPYSQATKWVGGGAVTGGY